MPGPYSKEFRREAVALLRSSGKTRCSWVLSWGYPRKRCATGRVRSMLTRARKRG